MKHRSGALQLSFLSEGDNVTPKIRQKFIDLAQQKATLEAEVNKILPQGSKLLNFFEQKNVDSQIALLNWLLQD